MTLLLSNRCEIFSLGLAGRNIQVKHISNLHMIRSVMNSLVASGQAANVHLNKVVILQKLGLCLIFFFRLRSAPLFACSGDLPIKMLFFKLVASLLHDIENHCAPTHISELFTRS